MTTYDCSQGLGLGFLKLYCRHPWVPEMSVVLDSMALQRDQPYISVTVQSYIHIS